MLKRTYNIAKARRWQDIRRRIRAAARPERLRLLRLFGDEIRAIAPTLVRATTVDKDEIARALEVAACYGVVLGSWMSMDPTNAEWPARDRLFVIRRDDLINACSALSVLGFFPPEVVPDLVEAVDIEGSKAVVPGIECPGAPIDEVTGLIWESAVESARDKKRWREKIGDRQYPWLETGWRDAPETWRTCVILDICDSVTAEVKELATRTDDIPAGLVALVKAPRDEASAVVEDWWNAGWDAVLFNRNDVLQVYETLTTVKLERPLALILTTGAGTSNIPHISKTHIRRKESGLLGEMSDDQFSSLIGESLKM